MSSGPTVSVTTGRGSGNRTVLEMLAVVVLGVASVTTAWCGFQVSRWNGIESEDSRDAGITRTEAAQLFSLGTQKLTYDAGLVSEYAKAVADGDTKMQTFLREGLMRPAFLPVLDKWEAEIATSGASAGGLFSKTEYLDSLFGDSETASAKAEALLQKSNEDSDNGDAYLLTTLLTALALFFAGVTTSFGSGPARLALLTLGTLALLVAAGRLVDLPIA